MKGREKLKRQIEVGGRGARDRRRGRGGGEMLGGCGDALLSG